MEDERQQAYLEVIDALLACTCEEEEAAVYQKFSNLVNLQLALAMRQEAIELERLFGIEAAWLHREAAKIGVPARQWEELNVQCLELFGRGDTLAAMSVATQALDLARRTFPSPNSDLAASLNNLATLYQSHGRWKEAEPLFEEALHVHRQLFEGKESNEVATTLNNLALCCKNQGKWDEAERLFQEALDIRRELFKERSHEHLASTLDNLGTLYDSQGKWDEAEPLYQDALEIRKQLCGDLPNRGLATSLNNLGSLYRSQSRWEEAEGCYRESLKIARQLFSSSPNEDLATILSNLGLLLQLQGKWSEAELMQREALDIWLQIFGSHPNNGIASSLENLGMLRRLQQRWQEAELMYREALDIRRQLFTNRPSNDLAHSLHNLATFYQGTGNYQQAELLYREAIDIRRELFKQQPNLDLAASLNNLALTYQSQRKLDEAEVLYREALEIRHELFKGQPSNDVAIVLNNLGGLCQLQGNWQEAEACLLKALDICRQLQGISNLDLALTLKNLAGLYAAMECPREALPLFIEGIELENRTLADYFSYSSAKQQSALLEGMHFSLELFVSLVWRFLKDDSQAVEAALNAVMQRKAASTIASTLLNRTQYSDRYPHLRVEFERWQNLKTQIALQENHLDPVTLKSLQEECERIREQLARQVPEIAAESLDVDRRAIALYLSPNSYLIEFFRFRLYNFKYYPLEWEEPRYIAFILSKDADNPVRLIDLGKAEEIDRLIETYRSLAIGNWASSMGMDDDDEEDESSLPSTPTELEIGFQLTQALIQPILNLLPDGVETLAIAPDGSLYRLSFATLPLNLEGKRSIDSYQIETITTARDLRRRHAASDPIAVRERNLSTSAPLIVADPDYDSGRDSKVAKYTLELPQLSQGIQFSRLGETRHFAQQIAAKLDTVPYLDSQATASLFLQAQSPRYLVVATHGFATPSHFHRQCAAINELYHCPIESQVQVLQAYQDAIDPPFRQHWQDLLQGAIGENDQLAECCQNVLKLIDNWVPLPQAQTRNLTQENDPMLRCGIALAGANAWLHLQPLPPEMGEGVLLARDLAQLNLWGTDLVVIIACSSALGDIKSGQGIFGLRRALAIAGAKHAIVSLWDVPGFVSLLLMEKFFTAYLSGDTPHQALSQAQNYVRRVTVAQLETSSLGQEILKELGTLAQLAKPEYQPLRSPFFWGAWICQG
jgi:tetratricopeptide (TPR) repeat protein